MPAGKQLHPRLRGAAGALAAVLRTTFLAAFLAGAFAAPAPGVTDLAAARVMEPAMPVAVLKASLARPAAMFLVVSMAVCLAASFMALEAICWNCCVSAPHHCIGSTTPAGVVDPMQWWGALTQQFQQIASSAMKDAAKQTAMDTTKNMAAGLAKEAFKTATGMAGSMTRAAARSVTPGAGAAKAPAKKAAKKVVRKTAAKAPAAPRKRG